MIDPEHLNDLSEMGVGHAARAAFLHAARNGGYADDLFDPLRLDLFSLLVLTVGEQCTDQDVSRALCVHGDRTAEDFEAEFGKVDPPDLDEDYEEPDYGPPIPTERFIREAAAALGALNKYQIGERVLLGRDRDTAAPGVIVAATDDECIWHVANEPNGPVRTELTGFIWRVPLTEPTPLPSRRDDNPGGSA